MIDFSVSIDELPTLRMLDGQRVRISMEKRKAFFRRTGARMVTSITKNFQKQGRPKRWAPLAPSTIRRRRQQRPMILMDTGALRNSISYDIDPFGESVAIGTHLDYSEHLEKGRSNMPSRMHIIFQDDDIKAIEADAIKSFLAR